MKNDELQSESTDSSSTVQPVFAMDLLSDPDREFREWLIVGHLKANGLDTHTIGLTSNLKPAA